MSAATIAILIAVLAAVPGTVAALYAYKVKHENPMENGQDWVVNQYRQIAVEATARAELAEQKLAEHDEQGPAH